MIEIERLSRYRLFREYESVSSANVYVSHCNAQKNPGKADCVKPVKANQRCSSLIPNKQQQKTPKQPKNSEISGKNAKIVVFFLKDVKADKIRKWTCRRAYLYYMHRFP